MVRFTLGLISDQLNVGIFRGLPPERDPPYDMNCYYHHWHDLTKGRWGVMDLHLT